MGKEGKLRECRKTTRALEDEQLVTVVVVVVVRKERNEKKKAKRAFLGKKKVHPLQSE